MQLRSQIIAGRFCCIALILSGLMPLRSLSQELTPAPLSHTEDFQIWTSIKLEKKINKKWRVSFRQGYRASENLSQTKSWLSDVGVGYKLHKRIRLAGMYRYQVREGRNRSRVHADVVIREKIKRFTLDLRTRLQRAFEPDDNHQDFLRERLRLSYNIRKNPLNPYIATEWFYRFWFRGNQWQVLRWDAGVEWKVIRKVRLLAYYRNEREFNIVEPELNHIIGLHLKYALP